MNGTNKRIAVVTAMTAIGIACAACRRNDVSPEDAAEKFVKDMGISIQGKPNCTGVDTDGDGYVTCTVAIKGKEGEAPKMLSLQCADITSTFGCDGHTEKYATGCKETQPKVNVVPQSP